MYTLATLFQLKRHLAISDTSTDEDDRLLSALEAATRHIERETLRRFCPYRADIRHDVLPGFPDELILRADLLELLALNDTDGSIELSDVTFIPENMPASLLRLTDDTFGWNRSPVGAVTVSGIWGWHDTPALMWQFTGDSVQGGALSESTSTIAVSDADATYADGITPRFSIGALLRIDSEFVRVVAVDTVANTLTVLRAVQGTSVATHAQSTPIDVYRPPYDILMTTLRLATWLYQEPDRKALESAPNQVVWAMLGLRRITAGR